MLPVVLRVVAHGDFLVLVQAEHIPALVVLREKINVVLLAELQHGSIVLTDPGGSHLHRFPFDLLEPRVVALDFVLFEGILDGDSGDPSSKLIIGLEKDEALAHLGQVAGSLNARDASANDDIGGLVGIVVLLHATLK